MQLSSRVKCKTITALNMPSSTCTHVHVRTTDQHEIPLLSTRYPQFCEQSCNGCWTSDRLVCSSLRHLLCRQMWTLDIDNYNALRHKHIKFHLLTRNRWGLVDLLWCDEFKLTTNSDAGTERDVRRYVSNWAHVVEYIRHCARPIQSFQWLQLAWRLMLKKTLTCKQIKCWIVRNGTSR